VTVAVGQPVTFSYKRIPFQCTWCGAGSKKDDRIIQRADGATGIVASTVAATGDCGSCGKALERIPTVMVELDEPLKVLKFWPIYRRIGYVWAYPRELA